ncbi:MAG TPA: hypothetical protein VKR62_00230 [Roseiarcus sp.]|nr:hypothetical protein [Roseiarcus sp.]
MKSTLVFVALAPLVGFASDASARRIRSCKELQAMCVAQNWGNASQCQTLYNLAIKEGGVWGSPAARAVVNKGMGPSGACGVD